MPGTKYDFWLYYSNSSISDWLAWTASITTAPGVKLQLYNKDLILLLDALKLNLTF
jgi:hypothetical protein